MKMIRNIGLLLIIFLSIGCSKEPPGKASITFDSTSTKIVDNDGKILIKGTVISEPGTTIENITILCLLYEIGLNEHSHPYKIEVTDWISDINCKEIKRTKNNKYHFIITEENRTIKKNCFNMHGIRINVRVQDGERSSATWRIYPKIKTD